jgi:membrane protease YdiL (CAAX protease family)
MVREPLRIGRVSLAAAIYAALLSIFAVSMVAPRAAAQTEIAILGGLGCLAFVLVWFIIAILIAVWVYRDAEKRGKSGVLWLIVVILLGIIGIIIWLIVRPPIQQMPPPQYGYMPPPQYPPQYPPQQPPAQPPTQP